MWSNFESKNGKIAYKYIENKNNDICILFLNAWGGNSCYLDFKNIIDKLPKKFSFLAIDYLGYGSSEVTDVNRNINNITEEISSVMKYLKIQNIIIVCHSMGGLYGLNLVKEYPCEIKGFIGIEPTTLEIKEKHPEEIQFVRDTAVMVGKLREEGRIEKWISECEFNPHLSIDERAIAIQQEREKALNKNVVEEMENSLQSALALKGFEMPNHIPTMIFSGLFREMDLAQSNFISKNNKSKFIVTDIQHYAHWFNEDIILGNLNEFLEDLG